MHKWRIKGWWRDEAGMDGQVLTEMNEMNEGMDKKRWQRSERERQRSVRTALQVLNWKVPFRGGV